MVDLQDLHSGQVLALFGLAGAEADKDAAGLFERGGRRIGIAAETLRPVVADLAEDGSAAVVAVGHLLEHDDSEGVDFAIIVDDGIALLVELRCEVEADDGEGLVEDFLGLQLGAVGHNLGKQRALLCGLTEIESHLFS